MHNCNVLSMASFQGDPVHGPAAARQTTGASGVPESSGPSTSDSLNRYVPPPIFTSTGPLPPARRHWRNASRARVSVAKGPSLLAAFGAAKKPLH